jgi:hypothetical protein
MLLLTDELSLSGAATTLYCCLKAPPSDCYHFFQDCSACPNRLPQANDDQASQKLCARRLCAKKSPSKQSMRHALRPAPREGGACAVAQPTRQAQRTILNYNLPHGILIKLIFIKSSNELMVSTGLICNESVGFRR